MGKNRSRGRYQESGRVVVNNRTLYGRRQGRPLKKERLTALEEVLPKLEIPKNKLTENHNSPPESLFPSPCSSYWLEIGFGQGEHVAALAQQNPDTGYLAAEPFINGMAAFLKNLKDSEATICSQNNIRVFNG